eukprot:COSAG05_NODE_5048_length_1279_cov_1.372034_2_plen_104_part_00
MAASVAMAQKAEEAARAQERVSTLDSELVTVKQEKAQVEEEKVAALAEKAEKAEKLEIVRTDGDQVYKASFEHEEKLSSAVSVSSIVSRVSVIYFTDWALPYI